MRDHVRRNTQPLGFLVLVVLFLNAAMAVLASVQADYRGILVFTLIASVLVLMLVVVVLAVFRPEALQGVRPWHEAYPSRLADDLYMAVEGAFDNLNEVERVEAWATLSDVLRTARKEDKEYKKFCVSVAERIAFRVATKARLQETKQGAKRKATKA
ncbi:hypothetical protein [Burkholderia vietnamiensis]|uniref:hypothetical protein n=1 Tax=Burkholderia vietnamiensis TaxID=60552 RepID=UPI00159319FB|nr:hypothetical protein [Burkholderia vietnamiensis]